jgi:predicted ester cyclase
VDSKAIDPDRIDEAVIDMVEKVKSNIQLDLVKAICKHKHGIENIDKIDFENGDLVTHNDRVAFKLDFKITHKLSLLIDRKGNFLP